MLRVLDVSWNDGELLQVNTWLSNQVDWRVRAGESPLEGHVLDVGRLVGIVHAGGVVEALTQGANQKATRGLG